MNSRTLARLPQSDAWPYVGGALLVCLLMVAMSVITLWHEAHHDRERSNVFTENTSRLLAKHVEDVFVQTDSALKAVAYRYQEEHAQAQRDAERFHAFLEHALRVSQPIESIHVVDANGRVRWVTGDRGALLDVLDAKTFQQLRDMPPGSVQNAARLGGLLRLNGANRWSVVFGRRMETANGQFLGVVYATLHNEVFGPLFESVQLQEDDSIALRTANMAQIDRYPRNPNAPGEVGNQRVSQIFRDLVQQDPLSGSYQATTTYDQIERHYSYQKVGDYPAYIVVGRATGRFWARLSTGTYTLLGVSLLLMVLAVFGFRHMRRMARWQLQARMDQQAEQILAASPLAMLVLDGQDVIQRANAAAIKLFGYPAEALVGLQGNKLVAPGQLNGLAHQLQRLPRELNGLRQDGSQVPLRATRSAIDLDSRPHVILVLEDLTRRRQMEARLHELLRFKTAVLQQSPMAIVVTDAQHRIRLFNPAAERLFGYTASEALQQNVFALLRSSDTLPRVPDLADRAVPQVQEVRYLRKDGTGFIASLSKTALVDDAGQLTGYLALVTDITELKRAEDRLNQLAHYDALTALPNRVFFSERVQQGLALAQRKGQRLGLLFMDLDHFKPINDTWGHAVGDEVLQEVAARIKACLRAADGVARLGGDEFVVLLMELQSVRDAEQVAEKIQISLTQPIHIQGQSMQLGMSIGIALYPDHGRTELELMKHADMAMYQAKARGRHRVQVFAPNDPEAAA